MSGQENISGTIIRGFELRRQIGVGGFGSVYNAYQEAVDREVAVKVIHSEYARQVDFIRRFEAEARLIARLEHMNIVPLYDYWREPSGAYLIMRWLRGGSARSALEAHGPWPVTSVMRLLHQIAGALSVAHHHGVVHRDIKPENILLDEADNAYLSDFGIAVDMFNDPDEILLENLSFGSPAYMSPEQLTQRVATPLADVYSLGILVYELLTGVNPFPDETTAALMKKQVRDPIPSLSKTRPELPAAMDVVIWRATAKTASARYQDTKLMAAAFQEAAASIMAKEKQVPLLNAAERENQDYILTSGLFRNRESDPGGTIDVAASTMDVGPFGQDEFSTVELSDPVDPRFSTVEMGDSTLNLDSALNSFAEGTLNFGQELVARNPYKGLRPFEEFDAADFFGRREVVQLLLDLFEDSRKRFLAVVGPSGSGKSSLVKAGLIPEIRQGGVTGSEQWFIVTMVPGDDPFQELAEALLRVSFDDQPDLHERLRENPDTLHEVTQDLLPLEEAELLIFIDQFEEVFTTTDDEQDRQRFLQSLVNAVTHPESNIRIVITLRADFYDRPLQYPEFGKLLKDNTEIILPLSASELEETITEPAQRADLIIEAGLSKAIVEDIYHQPGALPLLQYALTELYERRNERTLEHKAYQEIGGVSGALARRASDLYNTLEDDKKSIARQLFLRLITIEGQQSTATRRRQLWSDLFSGINDRQAAEAIINTFAQYRLLTLDRDPVTRSPTIEIAHEALINSWDQLQEWIEENRTDLQRLQRLQNATEEWLNTERDPSFLARGTRLVEFETLTGDTTLALGEDAKSFIESSIELRQRSTRRTRMVIAALATFSVIAIIFAIFALDREQRANLAASVSQSRALAARSLSLQQQNDLSLLLSVLALQTADTFEARSSLLTGLMGNPRVVGHLFGHTGSVHSVAYSDDASMIVSGGQDEQIIRWDGSTHQMIGEPLVGHSDAINSVDVNADGTLIASGGRDQTIRLWDAESGNVLFELQGHNDVIWSVDISPDSTLVASGDEAGTLILWDTNTGDIVHEINNAHDDIIYDVLFSPDGTTLATASADFSVRLWDVEAGEMLDEPMEEHDNWVMALAFSPNGRLLVSAGADQNLVLWSVESQTALDEIQHGHAGWIRDMDFNAAGQFLATASVDGSVRLWDLSQSQFLMELRGHRTGARVWSTAFHPSELLVLSAADDGVIVEWNIQPPYRPGESVIFTDQAIEAMAISSDGETLATGGAGQTVELWDINAQQRLRTLEDHTQNINSLAISPDNTLIASASTDGTVRVWEMASGELTYDPLDAHRAEVWEVVFTPDGTEIISAANNGTIIRWDAQTGDMIGEPLMGQPGGVLALAISPDGQLLAAGGRDTSILLLERETGERVHLLEGHEEPITALTFSQDGTTLISAERNDDGTIILWDVASGQMQRQPLTGPSNWVLALAVSPDNRFFASTGRDAEVILWDLESGRMLGELIPDDQRWIQDWINAVTFSPDGDKLYTAGRDQFIVVWSVAVEDWVALACKVSSRNLTESEWAQYVPDQPYREICDFT